MKNSQALKNWAWDTLREAAWAPLGVFAFYVIGLTFGWFKQFPPLDIPTHFMGGVAITYFYRSAIWHSQKLVGETPLPIRILFAFTCTGTTAVFWEFYENFADRFLGASMVRGLEDTIVDFILGISGALLLTVLYRKK
jgi:hypothetical protein